MSIKDRYSKMYFGETFENNNDTYPYQYRAFNHTEELVGWYYTITDVYYFDCFQFHMADKK
jgi:hypothetical protein